MQTYSQIPSPSKLGATLGQHTLNVSSTQRLFCLGLTVKDYQLSSKTGLVYYAMCKATESDVSSRWYKIDKGFHFYPGKLKFNAIDQREFRVNVTKFTLTTTPARASFSPTIESSPPKPEDSTIIVSSIHFRLHMSMRWVSIEDFRLTGTGNGHSQPDERIHD